MSRTAKHNDSMCHPEAPRSLQRGEGSRADHLRGTAGPSLRPLLISPNQNKGCPTLVAHVATRVGGETLNPEMPRAAGVARAPSPAKFEINRTRKSSGNSDENPDAETMSPHFYKCKGRAATERTLRSTSENAI